MRTHIFRVFVLDIALGILCSCGYSISTTTTRVGDHEVVIVDTSGSGASSRTEQASSGSAVFIHDSRNCKVKLQDDILIVNGSTYSVPNRTDAIRIEDGRVKINGAPVNPESR
jgi:hypothetical protein